jgi:putative protease
VEAFRLNFTTESAAEVTDVVKAAQGKLDGRLNASLFNQETDTRGHFNKEII